MKFKFS